MSSRWDYGAREKVHRLCSPVENAYPIYVLSKGRAGLAPCIEELQSIGARDWHVIVEEDEREDYQNAYPYASLKVLPDSFREDYRTLDSLGLSVPPGSGPARNFAWHLARQAGAPRHWVLDDNIYGWVATIAKTRKRHRIGDPSGFTLLERLSDRWSNVALSAHQYDFFLNVQPIKPFSTNVRVMSSILVNTNIPFSWRGRYNEDVILSLDVLTRGWCTLQTWCVLAIKHSRVTPMKGGNTGTVYQKGSKPKSLMLVREYPKHVRLVAPGDPVCGWGSGGIERWHHVIDYGDLRKNKLVRA